MTGWGRCREAAQLAYVADCDSTVEYSRWERELTNHKYHTASLTIHTELP